MAPEMETDAGYRRCNESTHSMELFVAAAILALVGSPLTTVLSGSPNYSALVLLPIALVFWKLGGVDRREIGLILGKARYYWAALAYPVFVMTVLVGIAMAYYGKPVDLDPAHTAFVIIINSLIGSVGVLLTEEGFFRGLLWGLSSKTGKTQQYSLLITALVFTAWHVSVVRLEFGPGFPCYGIPIYLGNVFLLGLNWGLLRLRSGSVLVPSISHAVWNALAYKFFGFGTETGVLAISTPQVFGPERGVLGLVLNALFLLCMLRCRS